MPGSPSASFSPEFGLKAGRELPLLSDRTAWITAHALGRAHRALHWKQHRRFRFCRGQPVGC